MLISDLPVHGKTDIAKTLMHDLETISSMERYSKQKEAKILIKQWRAHYNTVRPHSSLN